MAVSLVYLFQWNYVKSHRITLTSHTTYIQSIGIRFLKVLGWIWLMLLFCYLINCFMDSIQETNTAVNVYKNNKCLWFFLLGFSNVNKNTKFEFFCCHMFVNRIEMFEMFVVYFNWVRKQDKQLESNRASWTIERQINS